MKQFSKLKNGAVVLSQTEDIVLCVWDRGSYKDYVTWRVDEEGNAYWGHYSPRFLDAVREFMQRTNRVSFLV